MQFIDLAAQQSRIRDKIDARIAGVLDRGTYISGPEVSELETRLAEFCGALHCVSCANGTDALELALIALGIGEGDAVFVPSFTFAATAEVVPGLGATPVFVDVDSNTFNMDVASLERAIVHARSLGLRPAVVIPVDLFGLPADYAPIKAIVERENMRLIGDSAQGWGGRYHNQMTGTLADITTTSFFPAKPLGCYGDGGALFTNDPEKAALLDSLRIHGKGSEKYDNVRIGMNSRLDTLQAAILIEKLEIYADELESRNKVAQRYSTKLAPFIEVPFVPEGYVSIWAQYTLKARSQDERARLMTSLQNQGIPSVIYYPRPLHTQSAYADFPCDPSGLPVSVDLAQRVFSLPMHPYLTHEDQDRVIKCLIDALQIS
ncbi:DegT/DnrJ/EryC1/StrS aminotransferase family protein [Marivivens sp. LCG002]|uniref:DegT/DnrJ/EryC1/StrS family aminotransferase n=1 Tax=Marivivens sp. LCG002 TaxID=3051171 RepID=UPI00255678F9|nr:DegT/DnrJ/EryC1/StrS aminotransferase family protein [Marivivens sp. LCG002]WIV51411.1 DegT/DnrJ/EryC1/StrS aminotransferase family protein [Marivivens sp. LCG002]